MREKVSSPVGSGVIAIITILLVLILAIFSTLTLSTARGDLALAQRGAETVRAYYEADGAARVTLAYARQEIEDVGQNYGYGSLGPMNDLQMFSASIMRQEDGSFVVWEWRTELNPDFEANTDYTLPVWTGEE